MIRRRFMNKVGVVEELPYLTIKALEDGLTASLSTNACQYSTNGVTWTNLAAGAATPAINTGEKLYFKATGLTINTSTGIGTFTINKQFNLSGNCMSMLFGDEADSNLDLTNYSYCFKYLFKNCTTLTSISENFLPATTLQTYCYYSMFNGCSSLINAPKLPALTVKGHCYRSMFSSCTSLIEAPALPATTLASSCYYQMFYNCTSLTAAPVLPALSLVNSCYYAMFYQCTKLNYIKALFLTTPSSTYTNAWVYKVASTGTFIKNSAATWDVTGVNGIPTGWTVQTV